MGKLAAWFGAHPLRPAFAAMALILILGAFADMLEAPRQDRNWYPYLSRTPDVTVTETSFAVTPVSDWSYNRQGETAETYISAEYNFDELRGVWFMLEPQPGMQLAAHTLLLFEFEGDRLLGLTIEARREQGEEYDAFAGIWNTFELTYIWASARDLLTRRAVMLDHEVFVYPVAISSEQQRELLRRLLVRGESLETQPRYYNTLFSNCTNELARLQLGAGVHSDGPFRRVLVPTRHHSWPNLRRGARALRHDRVHSGAERSAG